MVEAAPNPNQKIGWRKHFPFYEPRQQQIEIIDFALDQFTNKNKRFVIVEAGTGTGKSFVALTIAKALEAANYPGSDHKCSPGAWILTTQKILQDQYTKDFGVPKGQMCSLKSSTNYQCDYFMRNTCSDSQKLLKQSDPNTGFYKSCRYNCKYKNQKKAFLSSTQSLTNFPFFLTFTSFDKDKKIKPRELLILDEAHNIEKCLESHIEVSISEIFTENYLGLKFQSDLSQEKTFEWIKSEFFGKLDEKIGEIAIEITELCTQGKQDSDEMRRLENNLEKLTSYYDKIEIFLKLYDKDNWVMNVLEGVGKAGMKVEFKSIDVGQYAEDYLYKFGNKVLLMSATILDKNSFCESIGINPQDAAFISLDSPFSQEKSPTVYFPVGKMSKDEINETLPVMVQAIEHILEQHKNEKGIIHTHSYKVSSHILKNISNKYKKRLVNHENGDRDEKIDSFLKSKEPLVLISPSSTEGLDLKDDLSRFQIICKIPFPFLGDKLIQKRMKKHKLWYNYETAKTIVQSRGRSIRNENDYATTYILDGSWEYFFLKNSNLFPPYFKKSIQTL